jgi:hypothetical protein
LSCNLPANSLKACCIASIPHIQGFDLPEAAVGLWRFGREGGRWTTRTGDSGVECPFRKKAGSSLRPEIHNVATPFPKSGKKAESPLLRPSFPS